MSVILKQLFSSLSFFGFAKQSKKKSGRKKKATSKQRSTKKSASSKLHRQYTITRVSALVWAFVAGSAITFVAMAFFMTSNSGKLEKRKEGTAVSQKVRPLSSSQVQKKRLAASQAAKAKAAKPTHQAKAQAPQARGGQAKQKPVLALPFEEELTPELDDLGLQMGSPSYGGCGQYGGEIIFPARIDTSVPKLVIVMDDLGMNLKQVQALVKLNYPVSFAFWPHGPHTVKGAAMAHAAGKEVLLHQPMEPIGYPKTQPGPQALFTDMTADDIAATVDAALNKVPYAVGVNNHMGSRFTQNRAGVRAVLRVVKAHRLFMLDSLTHSQSIFFAEAVGRGIPAYKRNVFLDVEANTKSILRRLKQAEDLARKNGQAIAIGHPLPETLAALRQWQRQRDKKVRIVRLQDIVPQCRQK